MNKNDQKLQTQPYKGARDFYPEDMRVRNYIFETWKRVCKSYGYEEYDGPFLESFEIYAAKSGDELVNEQLYSFTDRGGRKVAIRPEMTPTLARMVAQKYKTLPRPIRWFSVPNLWRYEKPQRGRLREFFQLNIDIFGIEGVEADFEILNITLDIMTAFGAGSNMFEIRFNNRRLMDDFYQNYLKIDKSQISKIKRAIDKKDKISDSELKNLLQVEVKLSNDQISTLIDFFENTTAYIEKLQGKSQGAKEVQNLLKLTAQAQKQKYIKYDPTIVRGLDYYTGLVFEQYDLNPQNNRAMYGGGRYDDLVQIFTEDKLTGTGLAMGDVTLINFLQGWNLMPSFSSDIQYLVTLWPNDSSQNSVQANPYLQKTLETAQTLRKQGFNVETWLEPNTKIDKQLKYADKKGIQNVVLIGENELRTNTITIKNLKTGTQETKTI